jgi:hypothetical protein
MKKTMATMKSAGTYKKGDGLKKVILEAKKTYKKSVATKSSGKKTRKQRRGFLFGGEENTVAMSPAPAPEPVAKEEEGGSRKRRGGKAKKTRRASRK